MELLSKNKKGFFIKAEGVQIDYGRHANDLPYVVTELHDFDLMVGEAIRFADHDGETLVIVTADHETGRLSFLDASYKKGNVRRKTLIFSMNIKIWRSLSAIIRIRLSGLKLNMYTGRKVCIKNFLNTIFWQELNDSRI